MIRASVDLPRVTPARLQVTFALWLSSGCPAPRVRESGRAFWAAVSRLPAGSACSGFRTVVRRFCGGARAAESSRERRVAWCSWFGLRCLLGFVWSSGGDCRAVRSWVTRDLGLLSSGWACRPFQWAWEHRDRREGLRLVAILPFGTCSGANLKPSKWSRVPVSDFTLCYKVFLYSCMLVNPSS